MSREDESSDAGDDPRDRFWPQADVELLGQASDWWQNACLEFQDGQWLGYVDGYRKATRLLAGYVSEHGRDQDYLVWPFVLCWRHHIELQLKSLIASLRAYTRDYDERRRRPTHNIEKLWSEFRTLI